MTDQSDDEVRPRSRKPNGQFNKGHSGNPKGRPKRRRLTRRLRHLNGQLDYMMLREMTFHENGKKKVLPYIVVLLKTIQADALKGDRFARRMLLEWLRHNLKDRQEKAEDLAAYLMNEGHWNTEMAAKYIEEFE